MKKDVIIEIPKNSKIKYEIENGTIKIDRILSGSNTYPQNYGFFENTLDWDGDPLDALVISNDSFLPGVIVPVRVLGAMKMIDNGETDTKLITVIDVDKRFENIKSLKDVSKHILDEIQDFFQNYKNLENKFVEVMGFEDIEFATKEFKETQELYNKYKEMDKKEFIEKMKNLYPKKYK